MMRETGHNRNKSLYGKPLTKKQGFTILLLSITLIGMPFCTAQGAQGAGGPYQHPWDDSQAPYHLRSPDRLQDPVWTDGILSAVTADGPAPIKDSGGRTPSAVNIPLEPDRHILTHDGKGLFGKYSLLAGDTGYLLIPAAVVLGILYVAPESISNWDEEAKDNSLGDLGRKWGRNVRNGPVWDEDDLWLNWIGHPYWGATYYIHARHYAHSKWESFLYAALISTCLYEYGVEAFAEEPSTQDLFSTPIGGWLLGEYIFLPLEKKIISNDNRLLGSRRLGKAVRYFLDPIGSIIRPIRQIKTRLKGAKNASAGRKTGLDGMRVYPMLGDRSYGLYLHLPM